MDEELETFFKLLNEKSIVIRIRNQLQAKLKSNRYGNKSDWIQVALKEITMIGIMSHLRKIWNIDFNEWKNLNAFRIPIAECGTFLTFRFKISIKIKVAYHSFISIINRTLESFRFGNCISQKKTRFSIKTTWFFHLIFDLIWISCHANFKFEIIRLYNKRIVLSKYQKS